MDAEPPLTNLDQPMLLAASPFEAGQVLDGKYEVLALLGRGGMGAVYRVRHILLNAELALKTLDTQRIGDASSSRRFQTEAKAAFSLKHPSLVKVHTFGVFEDGHPFLVMDLVQGKTLQTLLKERGKLSLDEIESIFAQLCFGLAHAHRQQVVHRDIKPANIMLVDGLPLSAEGSVKILDFGIAKIVNADRGEMQTLTQTGEVFGSPLYMSPEQCSGAAIDQRSDVYSLGCVLFEALTGTPPLVGTNALRTMMLHVNDSAPTLKEAALGTDYPEELEATVGKMLAKSSSDRYSDLGVVAHELSGVCARIRRESANELPPDSSKKPVAAAEKKQALTLKFTWKQLAAVIVATACVTSLCTLCFDKYFISAPANKGTESTSEDPIFPGIGQELTDVLEERNAGAKKNFDRVQRIYGTPVGSGMQRIVFPADSIGTLHYGNGESREAKGAVIVPIDSRLELEVRFGSGEVLQNAFVFDKIDPNLLTGLMFVGMGRKNVLSVADEVGFRKVQENGVEQLLATAAKWNRLDRLKLQDIKLIPILLASLDKVHPRELQFGRVTFAPHSPENCEFFNRIRNLIIYDGDTGPILKKAANSSSIKFISIGSHVSSRSIEDLDSCKSLITIAFSKPELPSAVVTAASKLKHVKHLIFKTNLLSKTQLRELLKDWQPAPLSTLPSAFIRFKRRA